VLLIAVVLVAAQSIHAQVSNERLLNAAKEPQNWLSYSATYDNQRYSQLKTITPANAKNLELKWVYQTFSTWSFETSPIVVDGVMYLTSGPNDVISLDADSRPVAVHRIAAWPSSATRCSWGRLTRI
jgi:alcohol dehydrogenase (cytochrome c)